MTEFAKYNAPDLKYLLSNERCSDVKFVVEGTSIPAHKCILISRSEYFRSMFCNGLHETTKKEIEIQQVEVAHFQSVLEFIYTGRVSINANNISSLVDVSDMFLLEDLRHECKFVCILTLGYNSFANVINVDNVVVTFSTCRDQKLKSLCKEFITKHYEEMIATKKFKEFITAENSDILLEIMSEYTKLTEKKLKDRTPTKRKSTVASRGWAIVPRRSLKIKK